MNVMIGMLNPLGHLEQPQSLAVALGTRHAEASIDILLRRPTLLMSDDHDRMTVETRHSTHDGSVFGEVPVAVQLGELGEGAAKIVEGVRPPRMAREPRDLPGRELAEDRACQRLALRAEPVDLLANVDAGIAVDMAKLFDLRLQLRDRSLEFEETHAHLRRRGKWEAVRQCIHEGERYPSRPRVTTQVRFRWPSSAD